MAPMSDAFRSAREIVDGYADMVEGVLSGTSRRGAKPQSPAALRTAILKVVDAWARAGFEISVPGTHASGISYNDLLGILYAQGREFIEQNASLQRHLRTELGIAFGGATAMPTRAQLENAHAAAVRKRVSDRILRAVRDVRVKALLAATVEKKRAHGAVNPALPGYDTGELQRAVAAKLQTRVKL
jgi:hypothetical protein